MQIDHTLVDSMVVDEVLRQSMGRPWITMAFALIDEIQHLFFATRENYGQR